MYMSLNQESDINKNILNRITYLINKRLSNFNLNKIDNIYENTKTLINEFDKQNVKLNNKINVLENLIMLMNKELIDVKKKINKNMKNNIKEVKQIAEKEVINNIVDSKNINNIENSEIQNNKNNKNIDDLSNLIELNKVSSFNTNDMEYREIKKEKIILDNNIVKKCLESHNLNSDLNIFKKIYIQDIPSSYYPIRHIKGNYQYWLNNKMNSDDENAIYIKDTLIDNITNIYLNYNVIENYTDDTELFIKNQEYIFGMSKQKYRDRFFKKIIEIINV